MLKVGDTVPAFTARASDGQIVSDVSLRGRPFVLFFFPRAFTSNCSKETKAFRDIYPTLRQAGVELIGVSTDAHERQCAFSEWLGAAYPMVGDSSCELARAFDVLWALVHVSKRATFVVDAEGIVRGVFHYELRIDRHVEDVKRLTTELFRKTA